MLHITLENRSSGKRKLLSDIDKLKTNDRVMLFQKFQKVMDTEIRKHFIATATYDGNGNFKINCTIENNWSYGSDLTMNVKLMKIREITFKKEW